MNITRIIPEYRGNILIDPDAVIVIQQCNTHNTFGSGIARAIREMFPLAYAADTAAHSRKENVLGNFSWAKVEPNRYIFNVYAQDAFGRDGKVYTNYDALRTGLQKVKMHVIENFPDKPTIALPRIGCGLGGGDWKVVKEMIADVFADYSGHVKIVDFNV